MTAIIPPGHDSPQGGHIPPATGAENVLGRSLRAHRHTARLTQQELAARAFVSERTIAGLENGRGGRPYRATLERLAQALGLEGPQRDHFLAQACGYTPRPPLTTPAAHNLPPPRTSFIGREHELHQLARLLYGRTRHRLITLIGPGGVGKTRLALQAAAAAHPAFPGGIWFVDLDATSTDEGVTWAVMAALGLGDRSGQSATAVLVATLRERRALLLLDNCEHLRAACAALATELLAQTAQVQILATSRQALGLPGETVRRVAALPLPTRTAALLTPAELLDSEAARLFVARAALVAPDFAVTAENTPALATLCARLDGLPLLLELVAAQFSTHSLAELMDTLADTLQPIPARRRGGAARQRSLRALLDWSYALLEPAERVLFRRLAIFTSGWTREGLTAVCGGEELAEPPLALERLIAQSLVTEWREPGHPPRYRLLETIRHYAHERLREAGEANTLAARHCAWYATLGERLPYPLDGGPEATQWMDSLAPELDNIRAALAWARQHDPVRGLRLIAAVWPYGFIRTNLLVTQKHLSSFLDHLPPDTPHYARALYGRGFLALFDDLRAVRADLTKALALAEAAGDTTLATTIRWPLAFAALSSGATAEAERLLDTGWASVRDDPQPGRRAPYRMQRGYLALALGDRTTGEAELRLADADALAADQPLFRCMALASLVQAQLLRGDPHGAIATGTELIAIAEALDSWFYRFVGYHRLGMAHEWAGDLDAADAAYATARRFSTVTGGGRLEQTVALLWQARRRLYRWEAAAALPILDEVGVLVAALAYQPLQREWAVLSSMSLWRLGRQEEAIAQFTIALPLIAKGDPAFRARCLEGFASLASEAGDSRGVPWLATAAALRAQTGMPRPWVDGDRTARTEAVLRTLLGAEVLAAMLDPAHAPTEEAAFADFESWVMSCEEIVRSRWAVVGEV